ncbi:arrestin Aly1 [Schizosaccharomyces japonicus yFS275]|uniref:Arrestin Aly1 n=1 Tax=Schizosaccharomyces japonicus (strain yFS275 / FY16936) TaxID=402676 RepID=B6K4T0_SCHJY|nr:arrestin Aly1 [Schizosaccharomyces japonicus yFS275]EEB08487.1 arrestin Aly1 [Schizosaccharomyces japonicus yFS275]
MKGDLSLPAFGRIGKTISATLHHHDSNGSNHHHRYSSSAAAKVAGTAQTNVVATQRQQAHAVSSENAGTAGSMNGGITQKPPLTLSPSSANIFGNATVTSIIGNNVSSYVPPVIKKPLASSHGGGMSLSIALLEPVLYLSGFGLNECQIENPVILRGALVLRVAKPANIRNISLSFNGRSRTEWPEGIPPKGHDSFEDKVIISHTWNFYNPQMKDADAPQHGADIARLVGQQLPAPSASAASLRGYSVFAPGEYTYNFDLVIPNYFPESVEAKMGWVRYSLDASLERFGAFKSNLNGRCDVQLVRTPSPASLSASEPINISRDWDDRLHYEVQVPGKSFRLGETVPVSFRFVLLDKVRLYKIAVAIVETCEYWCRSRKYVRVDPKRRVQLTERSSKHTDSDNLFESADEGDGVSSAFFNFKVKLPNCLAKDKDKLTFDTTYKYIKIRHRLRALLVLSIVDPDNPNKRKFFEINIETPVRILSCRCVQNSTLLPAYGDLRENSQVVLPCPCRINASACDPSERTSYTTQSVLDSSSRAQPSTAGEQSRTTEPAARPTELFRVPSVNPPPFDNDVPPPHCDTPPPDYEELFNALSSISTYGCQTDHATDDTILNNHNYRHSEVAQPRTRRASLVRHSSRSIAQR